MFQKLERILFYTLIFSIPFQTRVVLKSWGFGFNEWNAAFLYWTDLLILALLTLWFLRYSDFYDISRKSDSQKNSFFSNYDWSRFLPRRNVGVKKSRILDFVVPTKSETKSGFLSYDWFLILFLVVSAISIKNASNQILGLYQLVKLTEFSLLYFYIKSAGFGFNDLKTAFGVLLASGFFQAILAIFQYFRQTDLGLRFLGETVLSPDLFNVAIFLVNGEKVMRPYGTTPHPNVLALFLFLAVFIYYFYCFVCRGNPRQLQNDNPAPFGDKLLDSKNTKAVRRDILQTRQEKTDYDLQWCWGTSILGLILYAILLFGFFLTFSRTIIFVWLTTVLIKLQLHGGRRVIEARKLIITTTVVVILFSILFWPQVLARLQISPQEEAISLRGFYNKVALFEKPFFGIGLGNFVNWFREVNPGLALNLYQPVHNIYLLIFSETGILGLGMFLLFLIFLAKNYLSSKLNRLFCYDDIMIYYCNLLFAVFISLLFFGLFDHFLLTLQQGQIIFWLVLGLLAGMSKVPIAQPDRAQPSGGRDPRSSRGRDVTNYA